VSPYALKREEWLYLSVSTSEKLREDPVFRGRGSWTGVQVWQSGTHKTQVLQRCTAGYLSVVSEVLVLPGTSGTPQGQYLGLAGLKRRFTGAGAW